MDEENVVTRDGYDYDEVSNKLIKKTLKYKDHNRDEVYAYGSPITLKLAVRYIRNYWKMLLNNSDKNSEVSFPFGKDSLLSILTQQDCVGIRFYMAKKSEDDTRDGTTLVAVGVTRENIDIGYPKNVDGRFDKNIVDSIIEEYGEQHGLIDDVEAGEIREMVPPKTLGYYLGENIKKEDDKIAKVVKKYFNSKKS